MRSYPTQKSEAKKKAALNKLQIKHSSTEIPVIKTDLLNSEGLTQNLATPVAEQSHEVNRKEHIPILILLTIGMMLQLAGNSFTVAAGLLICVTVCVLVCFTVLFSAIFANVEGDSAAE